MNTNLSGVPPPFTPAPPVFSSPACPVCAVCSICQCSSCPACNNTIVYEIVNNSIPSNLTCPPPDLRGISCVKWNTPQKLAVGIVGGVLAGVCASVMLSYFIMKKQYKLKKISEFMKDSSAENNI